MHEPDYPSYMGEGVGLKQTNVHLGSDLPAVNEGVETAMESEMCKVADGTNQSPGQTP